MPFYLVESDLKFSKSKDMRLGFCPRPAPSGAKPGVSEPVSTGTGSVSRGTGFPWKDCRSFSTVSNGMEYHAISFAQKSVSLTRQGHTEKA